MRPKILLISLLAIFSISLNAQPLNWSEDSPDGWAPLVITPDFNVFSEGEKSAKIIFNETGTPYFVSDKFNVTSGTDFNFSIDILDNDPGAELNLRVRFLDASDAGTWVTSGEYSTDSPNFETYTLTGTAPADAVKAYVVIRIYDVADN